jgi:hypothetical protein
MFTVVSKTKGIENTIGFQSTVNYVACRKGLPIMPTHTSLRQYAD